MQTLPSNHRSSLPISTIDFLKLRQYLIEDICEGRIKGDQIIANILVLLKDTRRHLPKSEGLNADPYTQLLRGEDLPAKAA